MASGRALSMGRGEGLTKLLFDPDSGRALGGAITGANAGDLIAEVALAIEMRADAHDIALTIHPHPTLSETVACGRGASGDADGSLGGADPGAMHAVDLRRGYAYVNKVDIGSAMLSALAAFEALRRDLHAHPELGFAGERTAAIVAELLQALAGR